MKKELPIFAVILYIAAVVTAAAATVLAVDFIPQILDALGTGYLTLPESFAYLVSLCMSEFFVYYLYALILTGAGVAIQYAATSARRGAEIGAELNQRLDQEQKTESE